MKKKLTGFLLLTVLVGCSNKETSHFDKFDGDYTDTTYTNKELGFVFTTPEGAELYTEKQIADDEAARLEGKSEDEINAIKNTKKLMHATFPDAGVTVYAYLEYYEDGMEIDTYINNLVLYYSSMDAYVPEFGDVYPAKLYEETFEVLPFKIQYMDNVQMIYVQKYEDYILSFVFSYPENESAKVIQLIRAFTAITE